MLTGPVTTQAWATAAALPVLGFVAGLLLARVIRCRAPTAVPPVRRAGVLALTLTGCYAAVGILPLATDARHTIRQLLLVLMIGAGTVVASRVAAGAMRRFVVGTGGSASYGSIFLNITRLLIVSIGLLVILQTLGISIAPILTALGVGGLAVALALQDTLANLFAGIHVIASKYVKGGDYVRLETGEEGYVSDINWRHTSLQQIPADNQIFVPNAKLASSIITNFHRPDSPMEVDVTLGVSYDSDLEHVEAVTIEVAREVLRDVTGADPQFEPWIWYERFGDFSIDFTVYLKITEYMDQFPVRHEFIKRLHRRYAAEGLEIPFPVQTVLHRNAPGTERDAAPRRDGDGHAAHGWRRLARRTG